MIVKNVCMGKIVLHGYKNRVRFPCIMALMELLIAILYVIVVFVVSALPLYFAVKLLGGHTGLLHAAGATFLGGIVVALVNVLLTTFAGVVAFIALIFLYKVMFRMGWIRTLIAWALQFVFVVLLVWLGTALGSEWFVQVVSWTPL